MAKNVKKFAGYGIEAERLYVQDGKSAQEICATLKKVYGSGAPSQRAIEEWVAKNNWVERRKIHRQSPQSAAENLAATLSVVSSQLRELVEKPNPDAEALNAVLSRTADLISKLTKAKVGLTKDIRERDALVLIMGRFADYIVENEKDDSTKEVICGHIQNFSNKILAES